MVFGGILTLRANAINLFDKLNSIRRNYNKLKRKDPEISLLEMAVIDVSGKSPYPEIYGKNIELMWTTKGRKYGEKMGIDLGCITRKHKDLDLYLKDLESALKN